MKTARKRLILFFLLTAGYFLSATKISAQIFTLTPSSANKVVNEEFTVNLAIDTQTNAVMSADAKLTFDSTVLEVIRVDPGGFFPEESAYIGSGTLYINGLVNQPFGTKTGQGNIAIITLRGKSAGTSAFTFVCSQEGNDSNIYNASSTDIINCSGISNGSYTFTSGGGGSNPTQPPVPTATVPPGNTPAPTSTSAPGVTTTQITSTPSTAPTMAVPVSGNLMPTAFFGISGFLLTILGIALIL